MAIISSNKSLSRAEALDNAKYIAEYFLDLGWTLNAVCGMLGNMERESWINPGVWQDFDEGNMSVGFGLVQWTPATNLTDWATAQGLSWGNIITQCTRIKYEYDNGNHHHDYRRRSAGTRTGNTA